MLRREILTALAALATWPGSALASPSEYESTRLRLGEPVPFDRMTLIEKAQTMASENYAPRPEIPEDWRNLSYDNYRQMRFETHNAIWHNTSYPQRLDVFPPGLYFPRPVAIHVVEDGNARPVKFDMSVFDEPEDLPDLTIDDSLGYSGLRLRADLTGSGKYTEYVVFQGASYFRGIGTGQSYGLSARGLALKTGEPEGEEFPEFIAFWVEKPERDAPDITIHALMDSPSCTGVHSFAIRHGEQLTMEVTASLFAREPLLHVGIAPLTSMFLFDQTNRDRFSDFRPAVHDSDGLLIQNGAGEVIWRPLANPTALQISSFADVDPRGFGLLQRTRNFADFADLEANYHNRPGVWVTPGEGWGRGAVTLVEIPADKEIYDNIVAYWRPTSPIAAGQRHDMSYRLDWGPDPAPTEDMPLRVINSAGGESIHHDGLIFVIDFEDGANVPEDLDDVERLVRSTSGEVTEGILERNPGTGGPRLAFNFMPGEARFSEFRVQLRSNDGTALSEVWLYRWTAG